MAAASCDSVSLPQRGALPIPNHCEQPWIRSWLPQCTMNQIHFACKATGFDICDNKDA